MCASGQVDLGAADRAPICERSCIRDAKRGDRRAVFEAQEDSRSRLGCGDARVEHISPRPRNIDCVFEVLTIVDPADVPAAGAAVIVGVDVDAFIRAIRAAEVLGLLIVIGDALAAEIEALGLDVFVDGPGAANPRLLVLGWWFNFSQSLHAMEEGLRAGQSVAWENGYARARLKNCISLYRNLSARG